MLNKNNKNKRLLITLVFVVVGMFGFGFALVPMYSVICKTLGINGKVENGTANSSNSVDVTRLVTVEFVTTTNENLPWDFYPEVKKVTLHPGQNILVNFYAKNKTDKTMIVQAVPSISPGVAAKYLKKTECFCFTQQTFKAHEGRDMPVLFHIDTDLPENIRTLTLSYTMFDIAHIGQPVNNKTKGHIQ